TAREEALSRRWSQPDSDLERLLERLQIGCKAEDVLEGDVFWAAKNFFTMAASPDWRREVAGGLDAKRLEFVQQLRRAIFGDPFRRPGADPAWLTATIRQLAQASCDERFLGERELDPARLLILADALEEAGCDNEEILAHLRGRGPHVRGCWALDL